MSNDLTFLLLLIIPSAIVGAGIGLIFRAAAPEMCRQYTRTCVRLPWWVYGLFALVFLGMAALQIVGKNYVFAVFFLFGEALQLWGLWNAVRLRDNVDLRDQTYQQIEKADFRLKAIFQQRQPESSDPPRSADHEPSAP